MESQIPHRITGECGHKRYYWFLKIIIEFYMIALLAKRKKNKSWRHFNGGIMNARHHFRSAII